MSQILNELKQDLYGVKNPEKKKSSIMEMVFNDQSMIDPEEMDNPGYDSEPLPNESMEGEEMKTETDPEIQEMLSNVRISVLDGLRKLAKHPDSPQYDVLVKIFNLLNKTVETQQVK